MTTQRLMPLGTSSSIGRWKNVRRFAMTCRALRSIAQFRAVARFRTWHAKSSISQQQGLPPVPALTGRAITNRAILIKSEEHTSELQSLMRISYAVFCLKKKKKKQTLQNTNKDHITK